MHHTFLLQNAVSVFLFPVEYMMKMDLLFGLQMRCRINLFLSIRCEHCVVAYQ